MVQCLKHADYIRNIEAEMGPHEKRNGPENGTCLAAWRAMAPAVPKKGWPVFETENPARPPALAGPAAGRAVGGAQFRAIFGEIAPPKPPKPGRPRGTRGPAGRATVFPARPIKKTFIPIKGKYSPFPGCPAARRLGRDKGKLFGLFL